MSRAHIVVASALVFAACSKRPDFARASVRELILLAHGEATETGRDVAKQAGAELSAKPAAAVSAECEVMRKDADPVVRRAGVYCLGSQCSLSLRERLSDARAAAIETLLIDSLGDHDAGVRAAALLGYGMSCTAHRPETVADVVLLRIREQLVEPDEFARFAAAAAASWIGPAARPCEPALVAALAAESADGVQFMITTALGGIRAQQAASVQALIGRLADPVEKVRYAAACSLRELGAVAVPAIPALRARFEAAGEAKNVRTASVGALLELVTSAAEAEPVLARLLQERGLFEDHEQGLWIAGIGRLALLAPGGAPGQRARDELIRISRGEAPSLAVAAIAALARIVAASPEGSLAKEWLPSLRAELVRVQRELAEGDWSESDDDKAVLEALVDLVRVPRFGVLRSEIEPVLERLANDSEHWWTRDWAQRQLARLP